MSSAFATPPRQALNARQLETVERLLAAAAEVLDEIGHDQLTIRLVAARAGVSPATAYTYFASKEHLFAEMFWRRLAMSTPPTLKGRTPTARTQEVAAHLANVITGSPALAAAVTKGLLGTDPEVERLRLVIGGHWIEQFRAAAGDDADDDLIITLAYAFSGVLLQAGMGIMTYDALPRELDKVVAVVMRGYGEDAG